VEVSGRFQISSVPPQAPTVPVLYGDHPFVIEYEYSRTERVDHASREFGKHRAAVLLNAILIPAIRWISPQSSGPCRNHWDSPQTSRGTLRSNTFRSFIPTMTLHLWTLLDFRRRNAKDTQVAPEAYYGERWIQQASNSICHRTCLT